MEVDFVLRFNDRPLADQIVFFIMNYMLDLGQRILGFGADVRSHGVIFAPNTQPLTPNP